MRNSKSKRRHGQDNDTHNPGVQLARDAKKQVLFSIWTLGGTWANICALDPQTLKRTVFDVLAGSVSIADAKSTLEQDLDILPANIRLAEVEWTFAGRMGRDNLLKKALTTITCRSIAHLLSGFWPSTPSMRQTDCSSPCRSSIPLWRGWRSSAQVAKFARDLDSDLAIFGLVSTFFDDRTLNKERLQPSRTNEETHCSHPPSVTMWASWKPSATGRMCSFTKRVATTQKTVWPLLPNFYK